VREPRAEVERHAGGAGGGVGDGLDEKAVRVYICRHVFEIRLARGALEDLRRLRAHDRTRILDEIEHCLLEQPQEPSRNREELMALVPPWEHVPPVWELRVGEYRVFYDVDPRARVVFVRAVRRKGRSTTKEIV